MNTNEPTVETIEKYIHFLKECIGKNAGNMPDFQPIIKTSYKSKMNKIGFEEFVRYADHHYFVSRTLFMNFIFGYSFFSAYQCIENYLKAFLKSKGHIPPKIHPLTQLLSVSKNIASLNDEFINSDEISTIIYKFEPFYEFPRYPISNNEFTPHAFLHPDDIYLLDYFVLKFRELLFSSDNILDIENSLSTFILICRKNSPEFYKTFLFHNINFQ
jgi:hypothetical protein